MINIEADLRPITAVAESNQAIAKAFESGKVLNTLTGLAAEVASSSFNEMMDAAAPGAEQRLGHMYDWGQVGEDAGRLWRMIILGAGKNQVLTFDYKRSENEVPAGQDETGIAGDTRRGGHVFNWKAPIIENGTRVRIEPINGNYLAIPVGEGNGKNTNSAGTMWFTKKRISPPINRIAQGAFTQKWVEYFGTVAVVVVEETVGKEAENFFDNIPREVYRTIPKPKVNPKPVRSRAKTNNAGKTYYKNALGKFVSKAEGIRLGLQARRFGEGQ